MNINDYLQEHRDAKIVIEESDTLNLPIYFGDYFRLNSE